MELYKDNTLKQSLKNGEVSVGSWITLADTAVAEIMAEERFDWLVIDMEHSAITIDRAQELIRVVALKGVVPLVRVGENSFNEIKRVMDAGSYGVLVPRVNTKRDAEKAVSAVRYPPEGNRGVGLARAQGYGMDFGRYRDWVNREAVIIAQIEDIKAIESLSEILGVEGIDGSIIGPYDLSASVGYPGDFKKARIDEIVEEYVEISRKRGKPAGFHIIPPEAGRIGQMIEKGFRFLGFSLDTLFFGQKIRDEIKRGRIWGG